MIGAITWGTRLFGKVDSVPRICHVSTRFWHFCYLPLAPLGSYIILRESHSGLSGSFTGIAIDLSWKSLFAAWFRIFLYIPLVISGLAQFGMVIAYSEGKMAEPSLAVVCIPGVIFVCVLALILATHFIPGLGRASPARRRQLLEIIAQHTGRGPSTPSRYPGNNSF